MSGGSLLPRLRRRLRTGALGYALLTAVAVGLIIAALASLASYLVEGWAQRDAELRANLIFRSIHDQVAEDLLPSAHSTLIPLLDRIAEDERILALAFCRQDGKLLFATKATPRGLKCADLPLEKSDTFETLSEDGERFSVSIFPMKSGSVSGHLLILHDLAYIDRRERDVRLYTIGGLLVVAIGFGLLTLVGFMALTRNWTRSIRGAIADARRGEVAIEADAGPFPVNREIRALLAEFRVERKFTQGIHVEWSPETLHQMLMEELPDAQVQIVSNREPYIHNRSEAGLDLQIPASGLVSALEPVMRACGGTWIAHGSGSADRETVDAHDRLPVPPASPAYTLRRVWITDEEQDGYYYGFANEGLWPLCHIAFVRPIFREGDWAQYRKVNQRFADAVVDEATCENPIVLVQDYHLALAPRMIRERLPRATVIMFWHIPWPNAETFSICPWRKEIVEGLLGSSILGFHTQFHCNNFLEATDRFIESRIDRENSSVSFRGRETLVRPYPISIEWPPAALAGQDSPSACRAAIRQRFQLPEEVGIAVGVERFDYTKGILDRIRAVDALLQTHPEWRGKFVLLQIAAPTRSKLDAYSSLQREAVRLSEEINQKYRDYACPPIRLIVRHHEPSEVFKFFRAADLCIVSSLHDGMNLVAKEFVAARDDEAGVLVLSSFAGAASELAEAVMVNPYDTYGMAEGFAAALRMPKAEQAMRMRMMRDLVRQRNVYRWAAQMLLDASWLRRRDRIALATGRGAANASAPLLRPPP